MNKNSFLWANWFQIGKTPTIAPVKMTIFHNKIQWLSPWNDLKLGKFSKTRQVAILSFIKLAAI